MPQKALQDYLFYKMSQSYGIWGIIIQFSGIPSGKRLQVQCQQMEMTTVHTHALANLPISRPAEN